jgi:hypothetical protein
MNAVVARSPHRSFAASVYALMRFDLRRFRVLAAAIVGLEVSRAVFAEWALRLQPVDAIGGFRGAFGTPETTLLDALTWVATVAATVTIVQADLPSDDRAFWRTQPIAPIALALGKVSTLALLLVVAPSIVNAARLAAAGAPLGAVAAASLQIAVLAGAIVVPVWALALVTRTYYAFTVTAAAVITLGFLTFGALVYWDGVFGGRGGLYWLRLAARAVGNDWQARESHGWWAAAAMTLGGLAALTVHYRHRRWTITVPLALVLLAIRLGMPAGPQEGRAPETLQRLVAGRLGVIGIAPPDPRQVDAQRGSTRPAPVPLGITFTLPPLPRDVTATVIARNNRLIGRGTVDATTAWQSVAVAPWGPALLTDGDAAKLQMSRAEGFAIDPSALEALRGVPIALRADAEIRLWRERVVTDTALQDTSAIEVAGQRVELLAFESRPPIVLVRYTAFPTLAHRRSTIHLLVADRTRTRIATSSPGWRGPAGPLAALATPADRFVGRNWAGRFHVLFENAGPLAPDDRIYVVESRDEGRVYLPLAIDGLSLRPPPAERTP